MHEVHAISHQGAQPLSEHLENSQREILRACEDDVVGKLNNQKQRAVEPFQRVTGEAKSGLVIRNIISTV